MERREIFGIFTKQKPNFLSPPYGEDFEKCKECGDKACVEACEENIIVIHNNIPTLDFSESGCTFCDACANACKGGVLELEQKRAIGRAKINLLSCLAWHNTICSLCNDICDERAIKFWGLFKPEVLDNCTGCGFCVAVCPTKAITIGVDG